MRARGAMRGAVRPAQCSGGGTAAQRPGMPWTRILLAAGLALGLAGHAGPAPAHHGWAWTTGENAELEGVITEARLGNPHGTLELNVDGEVWTVEVGQPWRNERAGLERGDLDEGVTVRVVGEASASPEENRLKVERLYIDGREYVLYPGRD